MFIAFTTLVIICFLVFFVLNLPVFGKKPEGKRLKRIRELNNYKDGALQNLSHTPMKPADVSYWSIIGEMLRKNPDKRPLFSLPSVKPDFSLTDHTRVTWFGHSSYLLQVNGFNILVDPVFSVTPSPFSFLGYNRFSGTDFIKPEDLPELDVVLLTHDHYDHLDYQTILKIDHKTKAFITALGVGAHLEHWQIDGHKIKELSWGEQETVHGITFIASQARHFTGRLFKRNQTAWTSFVVQTPNHQLFIGGDSGYDTFFKEIGEHYGPFDLAILECGQYNKFWPYIHMFPHETVKAALDLKAKVLMPVHWGKYALAMHNWDEPIKELVNEAEQNQLKLTTPKLGEAVVIDIHYPTQKWWVS